MAFQGETEHTIDKTPKPKSGGSFTAESEKNLEKPSKSAPGASGEAGPGYPSPSKKEGGGKGVW